MTVLRRKKSKHRACHVCVHQERTQIEAARIAGISADALAKKHGVSKWSIFRHMRDHVTDEERAQHVQHVPIRELAKAAAEEGVATLDYLKLYRSEISRQFLQPAARMTRTPRPTLAGSASRSTKRSPVLAANS